MIIRDYREGDEVQIIELFRLILNSPLTIRDWRWKYKESPCGDSVISLAEDRGKVVGFYGLIPFLFKAGEGSGIFYQVTDSMLHPQYRGGNLFRNMGKRVIGRIFERGPEHIIFGFPNKKAGVFGRRFLGYKPVGSIYKFIRPLSADFLLRYIKNRYVGRFAKPFASLGIFSLNILTRRTKMALVFEKIEFFDKQIDDFWNVISTQHKIAIVRNHAFLNWRYTKRPACNYEIFLIRKKGRLLGYVVTKCNKDEGVVVDLVVADKKFLISVFQNLLGYFKKKSMKNVLFFSSQHDYRSLRRLGFLMAKSPWLTLNIVDPRKYSMEIPWTCVGDIHSWFLNSGELEL